MAVEIGVSEKRRNRDDGEDGLIKWRIGEEGGTSKIEGERPQGERRTYKTAIYHLAAVCVTSFGKGLEKIKSCIWHVAQDIEIL